MATSTKYPTANTPTTGFDGVATNPTLAYLDDAFDATFVDTGRNKEFAHSWRGFDFSAIPAGSTINSVTVKITEKVSASWTQGEWRIALFADVTSAGALASGVTTAIGAVQYTRGSTDTAEFAWDLGTLSTVPTLSELQGTNFGVRIETAQGNNGTLHTWSVDFIEIVVDYTAAGDSFTETATDPVGVTDTVDRVVDAARAATDPVGVTDTVVTSKAIVRVITEAVGVSETVTENQGGGDEFTETATDPVGVTDSVDRAVDAARESTDPVGVTDSVDRAVDAARESTDPVGVTDSVDRVVDAARAATDPVGVTDTVVTAKAIVRVITEAVGVSETVTENQGGGDEFTETATDPVGVTDSVDRAVAAGRAASDPVGVTDTVVTAKAIVRVITEAVGVSDSVPDGDGFTEAEARQIRL